MSVRTLFKRAVSLAVALAVVLGAPGLPCYEAIAAVTLGEGAKQAAASPALLGGQAPVGQAQASADRAVLTDLAAPISPDIAPLAPIEPTQSREIQALESSRETEAAGREKQGLAAIVSAWSGVDLKPLAASAAAGENIFGVGAKIDSFLRRMGSVRGASLGAVPNPPEPETEAGASKKHSPDLAKPAAPESVGGGSRGPPLDHKAVARGRLALTVKTGLALGTLTSLSGGASYALYQSAGLKGFGSMAAIFGFMIMSPYISELMNRLARVTPEDAPLLDQAKYPEIYRKVSELSAKAGLKMPELRIWDMAAPNAAAMGIQNPVLVTKSYVIFTPGILKSMAPDELTGIVGHELSHIRHQDILLTMAAQALNVVLWMSLGAGPALVTTALVLDSLAKDFLSRTREYLADLGGAALTGLPDSLASGLLRLDIWVRMVAGQNRFPVGSFSFEDLNSSHPPGLRRAEALRKLTDPSAPVKSAGMGSRLAWISSLDGVLDLFGGQALGVMIFFFHPPVWLCAAALAAFLFAQIAKLKLNKRLEKSDVVADRFLAYLTHPDPHVRRWTAESIRRLAIQTQSVAILRGVGQALETAAASERDSALAALFASTARRVKARTSIVLRASKENKLKALTKLRDRVAQARNGLLIEEAAKRDAALALLQNVREPAVIQALAGPAALDILRGLKLYRFPTLGLMSDEPMYFTDPEKNEIYLSSSLLDEQPPERIASVLYKEASLLKARRAFEASGRAWIDAEPDVQELQEVIAQWRPIQAGRLRRIGRLIVKVAQFDVGAPIGMVVKLFKIFAGIALLAGESFFHGLTSEALLPTAIWGTGVGIWMLQLGMGLPGALATAWTATHAYKKLRLASTPWSANSALKFTALLALPTATAIIAAAFGHQLYLPWLAAVWMQDYLLKIGRLGKKLGFAEVLAATAGICAITASVFAGYPHAFFEALIFVGLCFQLARHNRAGAWLYGALGFLLAEISAAAALWQGPGVGLAASLVAASFIGNRLTEGLKPLEEAANKLLEKQQEQAAKIAEKIKEADITIGRTWVGKNGEGVFIVLDRSADAAAQEAVKKAVGAELLDGVRFEKAEAHDMLLGPVNSLSTLGLTLADLGVSDPTKRRAALSRFEAASVHWISLDEDRVARLRDPATGDVSAEARWMIAVLTRMPKEIPVVAPLYYRGYKAPAEKTPKEGERVIKFAIASAFLGSLTEKN